VRRGTLRVYLGAAPGVGKTFAMLNEGRRRARRGTDVVVGYVECHGRPRTEEQLHDLEMVPRVARNYRDVRLTEMDLDAVLARRPEVALIDELAHTNVPGGRHEKRWQDVEELLDAGIDVISAVNVQHLESLNDVVERITGIAQQETVPDSVVRAADQIELVDSTPEALRRRMAHGNIYGADKVDAALANYFRVGNLTALRELALLWLADRVEEGLRRYRSQHDIDATWETRERVVVAVTGGPESPTIIRRAARIAARATGGDLLAVYVSRSDGLTGASPSALATHRELAESLGGSFHQVVGDDIPRALLDFARAENATQLVLGTSRRGRWAHFVTGPGIGATVTRNSGDIDVHMVTHEEAKTIRKLPALAGGLSLRRRLAGTLIALLALPSLTAILAELRSQLTLPSQILLYLVLVIVITLVGGIFPALASAIAASLLLNYFFTPPIYTFTIAELNNAIALIAFLLVAAAVSWVVDIAARRSRQAARATGEAETLSVLAGSVLRGEDTVAALLDRLRETFGMESVSLLRRPVDAEGRARKDRTDADPWELVACSGGPPCQRPDDAESVVLVGDDHRLALRGRTLPAADQRILTAFAAQAAVMLEQHRLAAAAAAAEPLAELDRTRTALLTAVSHDLRTPLASVKAAVDSLRDPDISWTAADQAELLATAADSADRLTALVENLLDMSRLQAGALPVFRRQVAIDEIVPRALDDLGPDGRTVRATIPAELPEVLADPALLERIISNVAANALRHGAGTENPIITASAIADRVELRIVDRGPGIPADTRDRIFAPFQRLGDRDNTAGLGLGLALSRGLAEAMEGSLIPEDTPGGGLTMVLTLQAVREVDAVVPEAAVT
jgi:two-component system, OmpR family, sensor histidine kinase KdpD